jgi:hypothetical protein
MNDAGAVWNARLVGSVLLNVIPVSPLAPFSTIALSLLEGGTIVAPFTVVPPVGTVIVLFPLESVKTLIEPGDALLLAAEKVLLLMTSPVIAIEMVRVAATAI